MRLNKAAARTLLHDIVDMRHPHLEVVQIHHADILSCSDGDVLFVKLADKKQNSLYGLFEGSVNIFGRIDRYRIGSLSDYGYFRKLASLASDGHCVTYLKAYSSAAKMAHSFDSRFIASCIICRGYAGDCKNLKKLAEMSQQYIRDLVLYCLNYVIKRYNLRVEEVITLDRRRVGDIANAMEKLRVFDEDVRCVVTRLLLERRLIYRFSN